MSRRGAGGVPAGYHRCDVLCIQRRARDEERANCLWLSGNFYATAGCLPTHCLRPDKGDASGNFD